jgi:tight adherence protein B
MDDTSRILIVSVVVAGAMAALTWAAAGIATQSLARYRQTFTESAHFQLRELFLFVDPARLFALNLSATLLGGLLVWLVTQSLVMGVGAGAALALLPRIAFHLMRKRRLERIELQLPDALMAMGGGMKAGLSLAGAVQQIVQESPAPLSQEFDLMLREQRLGVSLDESLENLSRRLPIQAVTLVVSAMRIAGETGGGLAETLERAAATLRSQHAMEGKIRALTAQGKLQAWIVGLLPVFLAFWLVKLEPEAMSILWTTHMGFVTLAIIGLLEFFGVLLIRKIVTIDV